MHTQPAFNLYLETLPVMLSINVDATAARRRVSGWIVSQVSTSCMADTPDLVATLTPQSSAYWRIPVVFVEQGLGVLGQVGVVHVNAQTGEIDATPEMAELFFSNAVKLSSEHHAQA